MITTRRFLTLFLSLFLFAEVAWATVPVMRYPSGTPVQVCQASDSNTSCGGNSGGSGTINAGTVNIVPEYVGTTTLGPSANVYIVGNNVGIGSITPGSVLDIQGDARLYSSDISPGASNNSNFGLYTITSTVGQGPSIGFGEYVAGVPLSYSEIKGTKTEAFSNGGKLSFYTRSHSGGVVGERVTINDTGGVGVGTTKPVNTLDVSGNANFGSYAGVSAVGSGVVMSGNMGIGTTFNNNGALIVMNGNVGIGTWKPSRSLDVIGNINASSTIGASNFSGTSSGTNTGDQTCATTSGCVPGAITNVGVGTANTIAYWDTASSIGSLNTGTYPSLTELSYSKGVTSSIQTQLNGKQASGSYLTSVTISTTSPMTGAGSGSSFTLGVNRATASVDGYLSATDFTIFNNKVSTTRSIGTTSPLTGGGTLAGDLTLGITAATTSVNGYLTSTDWNTFNNKTSSQWATQNTTDVSLAGGNVGIGTTFTTTTALVIMNGNVGIGTWKPTHTFQAGVDNLPTYHTFTADYDGTIKGSYISITGNGAETDIFNTSAQGNNSGGIINRYVDDGTQTLINARAGSDGYYARDDGGNYRKLSGFGSFTEGSITSTSSPGNFQFLTTPSGSVVALTRMYIGNQGNVGIGTITSVTGTSIMNGNVGIGTWNASQSLDVIGTAKATTFSGAGTNLTGTAASLTSGNVTTNANLTGNDVTSAGNAATLNSQWKAWTDGGTNVYLTTTTDNIGIGTTTPASSTSLEIVKNSSNALLRLSSTATGNGNYVVVTSGGNVGIGTLIPPSQVWVANTVTANAFVGDGSGIYNIIGSAGGWTDGGTNVFPTATTDNIGIGTTTPASSTTLEIVKNTSGNAPLKISSVASGAGDYFLIDSAGNIGISKTTTTSKLNVNGNASFGTYAGTVAAPSNGIISSGNIGIGTVTAGNNLQIGFSSTNLYTQTIANTVQGIAINNLDSTTGSTAEVIKFQTNSAVSTTYNGGFIAAVDTNKSAGSQSEQMAFGTIVSGTLSERMRIQGGNVGIGTVTANSKLSVNGAAQIGLNFNNATAPANGLIVQGNVGLGTSVPNGALEVINPAGGNTFLISSTSTSAGDQFLVTTGGNVGIGTKSPGAVHDNFGNLRISGGGFLISNQATAPTVANNDCGTTAQGTIAANSSDLLGTITVGTLAVTSCNMTFNKTHGVAPICFCQDDSNVLAVRCTSSTTKLTVTSLSSMSSDVVSYWCPTNIP